MKDILILVDQEPHDALVLTSLIRRFKGSKVHILADSTSLDMLSYCKDCIVENIDKGTKYNYSIAINISPTCRATRLMATVKAVNKLGYGSDENGIAFYNEGADYHYRARYIGIPTNANLFQLIFGLANETWDGEGYNLQYFPRNKTRQALTGLAIRDITMRDFVFQNLRLNKRLWRIPFKQNLLKQIDETNRCKDIVTDDFTLFNIALALRKKVEYIITRRPAFGLELFGCGNIHLCSNPFLESRANVSKH